MNARKRQWKRNFFTLEDNHTWNLILKPPKSSIIGRKWIYSVKMKYDGTLEMHKDRVVAPGYKQEYGMDYEETFSFITKMMTIRVLLTSIHQTVETSSNECEKCILTC